MFETGLAELDLTYEEIDPALNALIEAVSQFAERFPFAGGSERIRYATTPNFQGIPPLLILFHIEDDDCLQFDAVLLRRGR